MLRGMTAAPLPTVHVVGDSISMQYGPYLERYVAAFAAYSRKEGRSRDLDRPEGANGGHSGQVVAYLEELAGRGEHYHLLLVNCGLHDIKRADAGAPCQVGTVDYAANLARIGELAQRVCGTFAWIRTTPVADGVHAQHAPGFVRRADDVRVYNRLADRAIIEAGARWLIDLHGFTAALGGDEVFCDHVHFTEPVRAAQAAFIAGSASAMLPPPR